MQSKWSNSVSIKVKNNNSDFIENFTGFGKQHASSDQENYYSWDKNSIIFSKIAQSYCSKGTDITLLHYTCII